MKQGNSFGARAELVVGERRYEMFRLEALRGAGFAPERLPYSLRILLENALRHEDGVHVTADDIAALAGWDPALSVSREIDFTPARVLLQDFTGVPAVVDLAALRDAMHAAGGDPGRINPVLPVELVIDHSIQVDAHGTPDALRINRELDYHRNRERYALLKWAEQAFARFRVVAPNMGICHQVNLEHLARVVFSSSELKPVPPGALEQAYPDTLVGTDSHTPMVNGLGVLGWGVGGIEAEAAMLGQAISLVIPRVLGVRLAGERRPGVTATDLVLSVTKLLRDKGVVGQFVEFFGPGLGRLSVADRATIGNMSPEYGATCTMFPVDDLTLDYLRLTGRAPARVALVDAYMKEQGLFHHAGSAEPVFSDVLELDLDAVEPSLAGPGRPQDRIGLPRARAAFERALTQLRPPAPRDAGAAQDPRRASAEFDGETHELRDGAVVIAAITSCTNTSNPAVMLAAGLLARNAVARGLRCKPWVKTSLAPGSKVVTEYYAQSGLTPALEALGFHLVGYGCTTCIGNSGPLPALVSEAIARGGLVAAAVLSGNRNFEGRIHPEVRANYLMSPPLVIAFALAGRIDIDLEREPLGHDRAGAPVYLRELWPGDAEVQRLVSWF
jgi:aconitate hydratase